MSTPSNGVAEFPVESQAVVPAAELATRPLYWSVRREIWENRSVYLAPLIVTAVVLLASFASQIGRIGGSELARIVKPLEMAPAPIMFTTIVVAMFYSIDALYGERRDRSILFWKSLPVSDRTAVLAKAAIPLVVLPAVGYLLSVVAQLVLLPVSIIAATANRISHVAFWSEFEFFEGLLIMFYGLGVHALWFAPIYGWLMLVSAWARRAPLLWAVLPLLAIFAVERITFNTTAFLAMLQYRFAGAMRTAFAFAKDGHIDRLSQLTPGRFLTTPGLWTGLAFLVVCLAAAVRLRRYREPI